MNRSLLAPLGAELLGSVIGRHKCALRFVPHEPYDTGGVFLDLQSSSVSKGVEIFIGFCFLLESEERLIRKKKKMGDLAFPLY